MIFNRKAGMELSMGTIVILVLGVSMLILGMILIRSIMCSGLIITEKLSTGVTNEIANLFGADKFGVKCVGQGGQEIKYGSGGIRPFVCIMKTDEQANYELTIQSIAALSGASTDTVNKWVIDKDWKGTVRPGQDQQEVIVEFKIPREAPTTEIKIILQAKNVDSGSEETITSRLTVVPTGFLKGAIC